MRISKKPITILYVLFTIIILNIAFQNCSSPFESLTDGEGVTSGFSVAPGDESTANEVLSLAIFEKTLYQDIQQNCASCHGALQKPYFGIADSLDSHRIIFNREFVNLDAPENSYLAIKIRAGHNNFPVELADQFVASITSWSEELKAAMLSSEDAEAPSLPPERMKPDEEEAPPAPPADEEADSEEQVPLPAPRPVNEKATFKSINANILIPMCVGCHKPREEGGFGLTSNYFTYATTLSSGSVVIGDAEASSLYTSVLSGSMPSGGSLTDEEVGYIKEWIDGGAKNN